ncbi:MAG TPA: O-antigen ligase family protein [Gaiellaceae bacterium]|jgi:hypothetical protein|nr:O-antigen ligase family protein [Gaiellaceae bacterium]
MRVPVPYRDVVPAVLAGVIVGLLAAADGGFFPSAWRLSTILFCSLAGIALLMRERIAVARVEIVLFGLIAGAAAWIGLSSAWSDDPSLSLLELERALVYVTAVGAAILLLDRDRIEALLTGIVAAVVAVAIVALSSGESAAGSLMGPVGYANALGILCVLAILLAPVLRPVLAVAAVVPLGLTLVLTGSRGAWLALAAGLCTAAIVRFGRRGLALGALAAVTGAAVLLVAAPALDLGDRPHYWRAAFRQYEEDPLLGSGAGTFQLHWPEHRPSDLTVLDPPDVLDAHSLYLEALAELGIVGLALVVAALAVPLWAFRKRLGDPLTSLLAPPYAAFLVHAGLDWDWEMPAVTLSGLVCGTAAAVAARGDGSRIESRARLGLLAVALGVAAVAAARFLLGPDVEQAPPTA